jgi:hypothetical protein
MRSRTPPVPVPGAPPGPARRPARARAAGEWRRGSQSARTAGDIQGFFEDFEGILMILRCFFEVLRVF